MSQRKFNGRAVHLVHRYGHYGYVILATMALTLAVLGLFVDERHPSTLMRVQSAGVVAFGYLALYMNSRMHYQHLCEVCAERMPLNGNDAATKYRRALRITHMFGENRRRAFQLIGVIWAYIIASVLLHSGLFDKITQIPLTLAAGVLLLSIHVHYMLQLWCPWCHWGDGGREEPSPAPIDPQAIRT